MPYRAPLSDFHHLWATRAEPLLGEAPLAEVLEGAARLAEDVLAPLNRTGDLHPARLVDGRVMAPPGFAAAYRAIADGGWIGMAARPESGGMGLPMALTTMVNEMISGANLAMSLNILVTQGHIEALEAHADPAMQARLLPLLTSGTWNGTMNLTEPQAGSDVGALATRAEDAGDGSFRLTGQKIYITWADSELTENTSHLVLARLPDGGPGTKGISLFQVPKLIDGRPNGVHVLSLEHKMGLHGSPTCVLSYEGARGWLVGGRHKGMAAMFTLMNNARLGVGVQGIGAADAALQMAVAHARDRHQSGRAIIDWPDVRRMLAETRGQVFAARAIAIDCAIAIDMAARTGDPVWAARAGILTPIAKAFGTDTGCEAAYQAMQVHGGAGFVEGTGIAQIFRDVRVTSIYEGTNGIQALDLVGRKLADGGVAALAALEEATAHPATAHLRTPMAEAIRVMAQASPDDKQAGAVPFLRAFALILGGAAHARAAATDPGRAALARLYHQRHLPMVPALLAQARDGADTVMATLFDAA